MGATSESSWSGGIFGASCEVSCDAGCVAGCATGCAAGCAELTADCWAPPLEQAASTGTRKLTIAIVTRHGIILSENLDRTILAFIIGPPLTASISLVSVRDRISPRSRKRCRLLKTELEKRFARYVQLLTFFGSSHRSSGSGPRNRAYRESSAASRDATYDCPKTGSTKNFSLGLLALRLSFDLVGGSQKRIRRSANHDVGQLKR